MKRFRIAALVVGVTFVAVVTIAAQDDFFKQGLDAQRDRRWGDVITQMRRAIDKQPMESTRKVRPSWRPVGGTEYLPYYFLGAAHFRQDQCGPALDAWSRSEQQGVVQRVPESAAFIQAGYRVCEGKGFLPPSRYDDGLANATRQIALASAEAEAVAGRARAAGDSFTAERKLQVEQARNEIKNAGARLEAGKETRIGSHFVEVGNATGRARAILDGLSKGLELAITTQKNAAGELFALDRSIEEAAAIDRSIEPKKASLTEPMTNARQQGQAALSRARRFADAARAATLPASSSAIDSARPDVSFASRQFQSVVNELAALERSANERRYAQASRSARDMFSLVASASATYNRRAAARSEKDPKITLEGQAIDRRVRAALRQLDAATKAGDAGGIEAARKSAEDARDQLNVLIGKFGSLTLVDRGVHAALERGTQLFLNGEYQPALDALRPPEPFSLDMPFLEHVYVFRAAALHGLYLKAGAAGSSLRDEALAEVALLKALNPTFQPDARVFSPRFLDFFRESRATQVAPPMPPPAAGQP
jgi:hypothetical protein